MKNSELEVSTEKLLNHILGTKYQTRKRYLLFVVFGTFVGTIIIS